MYNTNTETDEIVSSPDIKEEHIHYTQMESSYIVVENKPSGPPSTYTFTTLDDLRKWAGAPETKEDIEKAVKKEVLAKLTDFLNSTSLSVKDKDSMIDKYPHVSRKILDSINENTLPLYPPPAKLSSEYIEEFQAFRKNTKYIHYYICSILFHSKYATSGGYGKSSDNIELRGFFREYAQKNAMFDILKTQILFGAEKYHNYVKVLYSTYGEILPELAYGLSRKLFGDDAASPLASDAKQTAKIWLEAYLKQFYVKSEDGAVQRSEFIKHFQAHTKQLINQLTNPSELQHLQLFEVLAHVESPEKVLGLPMIRRAPGMFIQGYSLKAKSVPNDGDPTPLEYKNSTFIETRELCVQSAEHTNINITTTDDLQRRYGYTQFRIAKEDIDKVHEISLNIGGQTVDRVFPSLNNYFISTIDGYLLFSFTNKYQIPPLSFHLTKLCIGKTNAPIKILYDVVKANDDIEYPKLFKIKSDIVQRLHCTYDPTLSFTAFALTAKGNIKRLSVRLPDTASNVRYVHDHMQDNSKFEKNDTGENVNYFKRIGDVWVCEFDSAGITFEDKHRLASLKFNDTSTEKYEFDIFAETEQAITFVSGMASVDVDIC